MRKVLRGAPFSGSVGKNGFGQEWSASPFDDVVVQASCPRAGPLQVPLTLIFSPMISPRAFFSWMSEISCAGV